MTRAALFIGVNKTGNLPVLKDAAASAQRLAKDWAQKQHMVVPPPITDEGGAPVTVNMIKDAIDALLAPGNVEQLFVYFSGHGVNNQMNEYWLLTNAPRNSNEAVNVRGSEDLARYCGVPHVVFISDACRTAADTIQAQNVRGAEIFPNENLVGTQKPVDLFYACALGRPSHEIKDVNTTSQEFKAIYTQELIDALCFKHSSLTQWQGAGAKAMGYIRPRPLRDHLSNAVANRIRALKMQTEVIQVPDAHITSDPIAWLSSVSGPPPRRTRGKQEGIAIAPLPGAITITGEGPSGRRLSKALLDMAIKDPSMVAEATSSTAPFGPLRYETQCGFKVRGGKFADVVAVGVNLEQVGPSRELVRVGGAMRPGVSVLFILENGSGIALPAIPEFIAALTLEDNELIDVSYEPSEGTWRWNEYLQHAKELRTLRTAVAAATRAGTFQLEGEGALGLARRLQYSKTVDPSLAVYAAYANNDLHRQDLVKEMSGFMTGDLGAPLFDIAMFARLLDSKNIDQRPRLLGFAPLLAQGWAYLRARKIALPPGLDDLPKYLTESLWTMFSPEGVTRLRETIFRGAQTWRRV
jgi:hypothetical protein